MGRGSTFLMNLRPYQSQALNVLWSALQCEHNVLLEAACSAGKTLLFSKIIQRLIAENPGFRVLILMDREVLVSQTRAKLVRIAPELSLSVGVVCASVSAAKTSHKAVTVASRQSLVGLLDEFEPVNLIVVDECHLVSVPKDGQEEPSDQFGKIITTLKQYNPKVRLLGVTATPYRLVDGYIYGDKNTVGCRPYWLEAHHRITVGELEAEGYLAPLVGKTVELAGLTDRLGQVGLVGGEYNLGMISDIMSEGLHIKSAVEAWQEHASDRKKTVAFCTTIEHAEKMAEAFNVAGIPSVAIHSQLDDTTESEYMDDLRHGRHKVFCSVAKLTTGMDVPDIDCLIMARPTKSAALYKQILGRGQRIAEGKTDCLVLDMVGNNAEFGTNLDKLKVRYKRGTTSEGKAVSKECPQCAADLHPAVRICPECDYEFPGMADKELDTPEMVDAEYGSQPPVEMEIEDMYIGVHVSQKTGKELLRVRLEYGVLRTQTANLWMCFPEDGYTGYAVEKGRQLWRQLAPGVDYPESAREAVDKAHLFLRPDKVVLDISGKYPEVKEVRFEPAPF